MALLPIDNRTSVANTTSHPAQCTRNISSALTSYPNYFGCSNNGPNADKKYCYAVLNEDNWYAKERPMGNITIDDVFHSCCIGGESPPNKSPCVHYCPFDTNHTLEDFDWCLMQRGLYPSYSHEKGPVLDTYCVTGLKADVNPGLVESASYGRNGTKPDHPPGQGNGTSSSSNDNSDDSGDSDEGSDDDSSKGDDESGDNDSSGAISSQAIAGSKLTFGLGVLLLTSALL